MFFTQRIYGNWGAEKYTFGTIIGRAYKQNTRFSDVHIIVELKV